MISAEGYLDVVTTLLIVVPLTRTDRDWPNHVRVTGVPGLPPSYAMTEQPRTISRERVGESIGVVDPGCLTEMKRWLADFLGL